MINKEHIIDIAEKHLQATDNYLVEVAVKAGNVITVVIDSDTSVLIDDCIHLSKAIEGALDRDVEDFELRVTSYGADKPLISRRQYAKNIGRVLAVITTDDQKFAGKLLNVDDSGITLLPEAEKKKRDKPQNPVVIPFEVVGQAKIVLSFK